MRVSCSPQKPPSARESSSGLTTCSTTRSRLESAAPKRQPCNRALHLPQITRHIFLADSATRGAYRRVAEAFHSGLVTVG